MRVAVLQLCPLTPVLEAALCARFTVHRLWEAEDEDAWITKHGHTIRAVVTGGHIGISNSLAQRLPALEIVSINGVGFDKVDLAEAGRRGYRVTNTPDVLTDDVADLAIGLIIALSRQIPAGDRYVRAGRWRAGDMPLGTKVSHRRYGILGLGRIGRAIAQRLEGFRAAISYSDSVEFDVPYVFHPTPEALAAHCDVLIVAAAASAKTRNLVGQPVFDALGPKGILVNVARGSLVDEPALVSALTEGRLGGAALDVFAHEPLVPEALLSMPNVVVTPHIASATHETREAMADLVLANLDAHFTGRSLPSALV